MPVFDTYSSVKRLQETGLTEAQAAGVTAEQLQMLAVQTATKDEFLAQSLRIERLELHIEQLRAEIKATEARLIQYMVGLNFATIATLAALFKWMQG